LYEISNGYTADFPTNILLLLILFQFVTECINANNASSIDLQLVSIKSACDLFCNVMALHYSDNSVFYPMVFSKLLFVQSFMNDICCK